MSIALKYYSMTITQAKFSITAFASCKETLYSYSQDAKVIIENFACVTLREYYFNRDSSPRDLYKMTLKSTSAVELLFDVQLST